jgi:hypothetical protein
MSKEIVKNIADRLGDDVIASACGVSNHSVRNARWQGGFPASWFPVIRQMCAKAGLDCPEGAFNFKSPSSETSLSEGFMMPMVSCLSQDVGTPARNIKGSAA